MQEFKKSRIELYFRIGALIKGGTQNIKSTAAIKP